MNFETLLKFEEPLLLASITDDGGNRLRALLCVGGHRPLRREILDKHVDEIARLPIEFTDAPYIELSWERYFMFCVRDEGSAAHRIYEAFEGTGVRRYSKSWFLDNAGDLSNSTRALRGKITHYGLSCMNHIVDILAYEVPSVSDLGRRNLAPRLPGPSTQQSLSPAKPEEPPAEQAPPQA
jgi:hypothetical protein